jgi:hypothetical protein
MVSNVAAGHSRRGVLGREREGEKKEGRREGEGGKGREEKKGRGREKEGEERNDVNTGKML